MKIVGKILSGLDCRNLPSSIDTLSILFTNDTEIHSLNASYRGKDKPTDVLSFSHIEGVEVQTWENSLGSLVISLDTAAEQAKRFKVTLDKELIRLLVHGVLHLFGYDHEHVSKSTAQKMRRMEAKIRAIIFKERYSLVS